MSFCNHCGKEIPPGARFCGNCGTEQNSVSVSCAKCGKTLEHNEKFCSSCGTPVAAEPEKTQPQPKPEEPKFTKEGKKIISGGPKSAPEKKPPVSPPPQKNNTAKKKRSGTGCFFRTLFILFSIVVISAGLIFVINILFVDNDETHATSSEKTENSNNGLTGTNIPGIVDIEPGDVSHLPENRDLESKAISTPTFVEGKAIKKAAEFVEEAFANGDVASLKQQLSESAQIKYGDVFEQIQPFMKNYAEAFKKRKLISSTEVYKVYEFSAGTGENYSAAFALQPDGSWKLVRF